MHVPNPSVFVLSLGGSLIIPKSGFDIPFLQQFNQFIRQHVAAGKRFFICCGGGATCRDYQDAAAGVIGENLKDIDKDWLGIHASRLNGHLMRTVFRDIAYEVMLNDYSVVDKEAKGYPVVIAAGWKPGWSTDFCSTLIAEDYNVSMVVNLSNIDKVYDKDPNKFPDAKPIDTMAWDEILSIVGEKWTPGLNVPFDPIASKKAKEINLKVIVCNGKNFENLENILNGRPYVGTTVS